MACAWEITPGCSHVTVEPASRMSLGTIREQYSIQCCRVDARRNEKGVLC